MKPNHFWPTIIIFLFTCSLTLSAQTVEIKGVVRNEFPVKEGKVIVYLPKDIRTGDVISGTVIAEPSGNTEKEKSRNMALLQKYQVSVGPVITHVSNQSQPIKFVLAEFKSTLIALSDNKTAEITSFPVPIINEPLQAPPTISVPTHALTGSPLRIIGPFDGDASNTKCRIDGKEMEILAESPRQTFVALPETTSGPHTITIDEKGTTTEKKISAVKLDLTAPKTNLMRGEKTELHVSISGLEGITEPVKLVITNTSPSTINITGGNTQTIDITPSQVGNNGTYTQAFIAQSLRTGNFTVNADLDLPDPPTTTNHPSIAGTGIGNCAICGQTMVMDGAICNALQGTTGNPVPYSGPASMPSTVNADQSFHLSTTVDKKSLYITMKADPMPGSSVDWVMFTYSVPGNNDSIYYLGTDSTTVDGLSLKYPYTAFEYGSYNLQATTYSGHIPVYSESSLLNVYPDFDNTINSTGIQFWRNIYQRILDSIKLMNNKLESSQAQLESDEREKYKTDSTYNANNYASTYLAKLDKTLEQVPNVYLDSVRMLLDSVKNSGITLTETDVDDMNNRVDSLQKAADLCKKQLDDLKNQPAQLQQQIINMQNQLKQAFQQIHDLVRDEGYVFVGSCTSDSKGNWKYSWGLFLSNDRGGHEVVKGYPAGSLGKISNLEKQMNALIGAISAATAQLNQIPSLIKEKEKECDDLDAQLQKAKAAVQKGIAGLKQYNQWMVDMHRICSEIRRLLGILARWCYRNPEICSFENVLQQFPASCPETEAEWQTFFYQFHRIVEEKKLAESSFSGEASTAQSSSGEYQKKIDNDYTAIDSAKAELDKLAWELDRASANESAAEATERNRLAEERRKNELEKQRLAREEQERLQKEKEGCEKILKLLLNDKSADMTVVEMLSKMKEDIESLADQLLDATKEAKKLNKNIVKSPALKNALTKLQTQLKSLKGYLGQFEKYKALVDKIVNAEKILETFMAEPNAENNANKFGEMLDLLQTGLGEVTDAFPILQFFSAYFGYLVDGYHAAVGGIEAAGNVRTSGLIEQTLNGHCPALQLAFMNSTAENKMEDVYRAARKICDRDVRIRTSSQESGFEEALRGIVNEMLIKCCLKRVAE